MTSSAPISGDAVDAWLVNFPRGGCVRVRRSGLCSTAEAIRSIDSGVSAVPVERRGEILRATLLGKPPDLRRAQAENTLQRCGSIIARRQQKSREQPAWT